MIPNSSNAQATFNMTFPAVASWFGIVDDADIDGYKRRDRTRLIVLAKPRIVCPLLPPGRLSEVIAICRMALFSMRSICARQQTNLPALANLSTRMVKSLRIESPAGP
jgi:hypothetical protein